MWIIRFFRKPFPEIPAKKMSRSRSAAGTFLVVRVQLQNTMVMMECDGLLRFTALPFTQSL